MWKQGKMLAVCMFALAWWSIFYPELCFAEGTCEAVLTAETERPDGQAALQSREADEGGGSVMTQNIEADMASGILYADDDEIVISSRFLEWCEERLLDTKK